MALDSQGRLILRDSGKIVLPYEHFANAVMLKHMTGPHGMHLSVDATIRSVVESYTIGRENFGMEKEFIVEVVQSCPNPACRYYKSHLGSNNSFMDAAFQSAASQANAEFMQYGHLAGLQVPGGQQQTTNASGSSSISERSKIESNNKFQKPSLAQLQASHGSSSAVAAAAAAVAAQQQQV